ncbi:MULTISPECIES: ABC-F family ATP-binding cassette domain-containing protein [Sphingobium]|jgi:ATPase subunit of ABC transporter with duplicated ATPase domains|uniref:ABC transporter ATP-binding protein n=1 Tax=Sphingobium fuliginis (strain ATCC 27551) TaxID=336203 RepID=A0A292ZHH8_SPHSA|nr:MULTISPECIES: ABC-F family ATP-binding cassette domain-containing protein [Sphingobium]QOT70558.1 ABC-F family ATP-binding cassette domain-containing protein [Sphingobium fuliginis]GAY22344.1 ABC transporter ATP-binding protein [Sphingobium fuliginis]
MPSIVISQLGWSAPDGTAVLSGLDFRFTAERLGLVGRNGVGKSTLLALIAGQRAPASGTIRIDGGIATLRQTVQVAPEERIADLFGAREALALLGKAERGEADMAELEACDWTLPGRIEEALASVGLAADPDTPLLALSGGQRSRAALAGAAFARPDFLLLDEPTNNLDAEGRAALSDLLSRWKAGAIVVSHDRALLEQMEAIAELTSLGIQRYGGNWTAYRERKAVELAAAGQQLEQAERRMTDIARRTQIAAERKQRRDAAGARKGAKGDMPRILIGMRKNRAEGSGGDAARLADRLRREAEEAAQAARSRIEIVESLTVALPSTGLQADRQIVRIDRVSAGYRADAPVLRDFSLRIDGPERIAVTGPNGAGKSTLLKLIAGLIPPLSGTVQLSVDCALLDQGVGLLDPQASIAANFARLHPRATENAVRAALARFRFRADLALQRVGTLSGGQLLRAGLACVLGGDTLPPLLMLDEPTNHLDLDSVAAIEQGLAAFDGALIVISHDAAFLEAVGIGREVSLE